MKLSDFLGIIKTYSPIKQQIYPFMIDLFDSFIDENESQVNPILDYEMNSVRKIFKGNSNLSKTNAKLILSLKNLNKFSDYLSTFSNSAIDNIVHELTSFGAYIDEEERLESIGNVLSDILLSICNPSLTNKQNTKNINSLKAISRNSFFSNNTLFTPTKEYIFVPIDPSIINNLYCVKQLLALYSVLSNQSIDSIDDIVHLSKKLYKNFQMQYRCITNIYTIKQNICRLFNDGEEQFKILENEMYEFIQPTLIDFYPNHHKKFLATLSQSMNFSLSKSILGNIQGLIGNNEKKGVVHLLVESKFIESWIDDE